MLLGPSAEGPDGLRATTVRDDPPAGQSLEPALRLSGGGDNGSPGEIGGLLRLYIAAKSKPVAILCGPSGTGKLAAARALGTVLTAPNAECFQEMVGHAWWASRSRGVALFTEAQQRFNNDKLAALLEEAEGGREAGRVFVALLSRISPAEGDLLVDLAAQLHRRCMLARPASKARRPPGMGGNILLLATVDTPWPGHCPWPTRLLKAASILPWTYPDPTGIASSAHLELLMAEAQSFTFASVRHPRDALQRLRSLRGWRDAHLRHLLATARAMSFDGAPAAERAAGEALVYLANAWTWEGRPLLASAFEDNLRLAQRLAIRLVILPRLEGRPRAAGEEWHRIAAVLDGRASASEASARRKGLTGDRKGHPDSRFERR
jgi:hypothetical protein